MPGAHLDRAVELHELLGVGVDPDQSAMSGATFSARGTLPAGLRKASRPPYTNMPARRGRATKLLMRMAPGVPDAGRASIDRCGAVVSLGPMDDVLGYEGKHAVVTGAASGMGEQVARICHELGANVTALDLKPVSTPVKTSIELDLLDHASIDSVVAQIDDPVDAVFSCAGLPGPPFTDLQTAIVNFIGARTLMEGLLPKIPEGGAIACIASGAGVGWQQELANYAPLLATRRSPRASRGARPTRRSPSRWAATACRRS